MRRLLSFVLLLIFGLPTVAAALGGSSDPDSLLPACCRRNGAHHCMMSQAEIDALLHGTHFTSLRSKCPYYPTAATPLQHQQLAFRANGAISVSLISMPVRIGQIRAWARVAERGARHKRGPPHSLL
ncbi:hypothetical protein GOB94_01620 [Granulicella sp. 5B5]|uniref:hypothetical protein n=1 Tax=Granulicella sp. 5B5 TaxID=1617967 RepID=UPI0015F4DBA3|nr:hypothetical protein [Granulicella sp. 5B5]QMV17544.1 hypothetical protein GOB94_01620 [Granulicella sp. 5B5]